MQRILSLIFIVQLTSTSFAQLQLLSIPKHVRTVEKCCVSGRTVRTKELDAMPLPLWDDFSYASESDVDANDTIWQYGRSVWANNGRGINPPSIGVATFDGIDSVGKPYSVNDILAKGIADRLVSRPLRLDLVEISNRESVFLSFYFQFRGNGEPPDAGDQFIISIKNDKGKWNIIKVIENDGTFKPDTFYPAILQISGEEYFHDNFQFRFESFGRLSGPYDTWNLDYVYLNKGRNTKDTSFPDRTITSSLTSLFNTYYSLPLEHFLLDPVASMSKPSVTLFNLKSTNDNDPNAPPDEQPFNYTTTATISTTSATETSSVKVSLDTKQEAGFNISPIKPTVLTVKTTPDPNLFSAGANEIKVSFNLGISTKDSVTPTYDGDYDSLKYQPIDFRYNDTTRIEYTLSDYYAYDDGTAEYGASLVQPGSQLAYLFELKNKQLDTLVRIDMYFPKFGDESSQVIQLKILRDLTNSPGSTLYSENVTIERSQLNEFWKHTLIRPIGIAKQFYIALKQTSSAIIAIGLDKNSNSGQKIFFNSNGTWAQNINVAGSLMIRPAFGKGDSVNTAVNKPKEITQRAYPNPTNGIFFIPASSENVHIFNMTGRLVEHLEYTEGDHKRIELQSPLKGIYILKFFQKEEIVTQKILVQD